MGRHRGVFIFWNPSPVLCDGHITNGCCEARMFGKGNEVCSQPDPAYTVLFFAVIFFDRSEKNSQTLQKLIPAEDFCR